MKNIEQLPAEIIELFASAAAIEPNTKAAHRPPLLNSMVLAHHPASCRAIASTPTQRSQAA